MMKKGERKEYRYYISSLTPDIETFKRAAQNQNIIRKWSLSILKMIEIMKPGLSMKKKRFAISLRSIQYLEKVLSV